jgi:membrane associated rhomboid family serine protease
MFLLPLGLQSRIIKWPIASLIIMGLTCAVTIFYFSQNAAYENFARDTMGETGLPTARVALLKDSCALKFEPGVCEFLRGRLNEDDLKNLSPLLKDLQKDQSLPFLTTLKVGRWLADENFHRKIKEENIVNSHSYQRYVQVLQTYRQKLVDKAQEVKLLMRGNVTPLTLFKAMATHQGWMHLIGNMLIFALFAFFLEQRIGSFALLLLYVLGGLGSNWIQTPFLNQGIYLLGASGAVSAVTGAFAVYFWREKMRVWLNLAFVYNRIVLMPAWVYIGFFFVAGDFVGVLNASSSVAHLAHLGGFLIGAFFAVLQMELYPLKKTFLFVQEQKLYYEAKETDALDEKMVFFMRIFELNRESFYSFRALFNYFCKHGFQFSTLKEEHQDFASHLLTSCLNYSERNAKYDLTQEILSLTPLSWNLASLDLPVAPTAIKSRAQNFRKVNDFIQTLRLYDLFLAKFAVHPKAQDIQADIMKIFDEIETFDPETKSHFLDALLAYAAFHPENNFQTQLNQLIHQVQREERNAAG